MYRIDSPVFVRFPINDSSTLSVSLSSLSLFSLFSSARVQRVFSSTDSASSSCPSSSFTDTLGGVLSYTSLALNFVPRTDGKFLTKQAGSLIAEGKYAKIPLIAGNQYDEGSVLALGSLNISTTDELDGYLKNNFFPNTTVLQRKTILGLYPQDPTKGSPFDTGFLNILTPQNKRINAIIG